MAKCARCGSPLSGKHGYSKRANKEYRSQGYICNRKVVGACNQRSMAERYIETQFIKYLNSLNIPPHIVDDVT
ncbi:zinc ribbon domain-containing protein [uncultured Rossellomorea sp.]|uniref:zinc ribbon domain-containing protein n=1 Tax=Rossellomorea sp. y25 TaxID=3118174 RepID=UPI00342A65FF